MNQEFQLLLSCARSRPDARSIRDLIDNGIDWRRLLTLAAHHCVRPLLYQALNAACWDAVPQDIRSELILVTRTIAQKNLRFTGELLRLLHLFHHHEIQVATFKGPVLAHSVYGDISLREYSDLDVIIHEADLSKAEDLLTACGYQADFPDQHYRSVFQSYQGQYAFRHNETGIAIDLHWRLSGLHTEFQLAEIWPRLQSVTLAGRTVLSFDHNELAVFLAAHGTKEGWRSLIWVCDFAELIRKHENLDWGAVLNYARRSHSSRSLLLAIALAATLLDAPAPAALIDSALKNSAIRTLAEQAQRRMLSLAPTGEVRELFEGLTAYDRLQERLWPLARLLITRTSSDYRTMPLPKPLWGIYYLTRPFRLSGKMVRKAFGTGS